MRRVGTRALAFGALAIAATASGAGTPGCTSTKPTELVPGVLSQVQVPRDLAGITIQVLANGAQVFCGNYQVYSGTVQLPSTLGVLEKQSPETIVTITVRGYDQAGLQGQDYASCGTAPLDSPAPTSSNPAGVGPGARVLRRSVQTYVDGHELFLPMNLSYSCFDVDCSKASTSSGDATCKGNQCVDTHIDPTKLADFNPDLLSGESDCFSPSSCFGDAVPAYAVDASTCTYGFPPQEMVPGTGLNVRVFYKDMLLVQDPVTRLWEPHLANAGESEILTLDGTEGFTTLPNQQFQLPAGLCNLAKAAATPPAPPTTAPDPTLGCTTWQPGCYRVISDIEVASACPARSPLLPICASERQATYTANLPDGGSSVDGGCNVAQDLSPTASAVYVAMDDSDYMHGAYGATGGATVLGLSLDNPVFKRTFAAFTFFTDGAAQTAECTSATTSYASPAIPFGLVTQGTPTVQQQIAAKIAGWMPADGSTQPPDAGPPPSFMPKPLDLQAVLRPDAGAYAGLASFLGSKANGYNVKGVMVFVNRPATSTADPTDGGAPNPWDDDNDCTPPLGGAASAQAALENAAASAFQSAGIQTYFVVLADDAGNGPATLQYYAAIQSAVQGMVAGSNPDNVQVVNVLDATSGDTNAVLANFASVETQLGTCLYEPPEGAIDPTWQVSFSTPGVAPTVVPYSAQCNAANAMSSTVDGWNTDSAGRVRICGKSCTGLRTLIFQVTAAATQMKQAVPDVPVSATPLCASADGG